MVVGVLLLGGSLTATAHATDALTLSQGAQTMVSDGTVANWLGNNNATGGYWVNPPPNATTAAGGLASSYNATTSATSGMNAPASALQQQTERLTVRAGLAKGIRALGVLSAAADVATIGWKIGSGIRDVFGTVEVPAVPIVAPTLYDAGRFTFMAQGATPNDCGTFCAMPVDGWLFEFRPAGWQWSGAQTMICDGGSGGAASCTAGPLKGSQIAVPEGFEFVSGNYPHVPNQPGYAWCRPTTGSTEGQYACPYGFYYTPDHAGKIKRSGGSTTPASYTKEGSDSTARNYTTATTNISNEIHNDGCVNYATLCAWLNHKADPANTPDPTVESLTIPQPAVGESYDTYLGRLQALGYVGTPTRVNLSDATMSLTQGPSAVVSTIPATGTSVSLNDPITIRVNPETAPAPGEQSEPTIPAVDFGPLGDIPLGEKFPFAVPGWAAAALGGWGGPETCPGNLSTDDVIPGHDLPVPFCQMGPALAVIRPVILVVSLLGLAWMFAGAAMGFGGRGGDDD